MVESVSALWVGVSLIHTIKDIQTSVSARMNALFSVSAMGQTILQSG